MWSQQIWLIHFLTLKEENLYITAKVAKNSGSQNVCNILFKGSTVYQIEKVEEHVTKPLLPTSSLCTVVFEVIFSSIDNCIYFHSHMSSSC